MRSLDFSPDGKWLASAGGANAPLTVWNVGTWEEAFPLPETAAAAVLSVCFSADSQYLAAANARDFGLWRLEPREELDPLESPPNSDETGQTWCAFPREGILAHARLVTRESKETIVFREVTTGRVVQRLEFEQPTFRTFAFTRDGRRMATGRIDNGVDIYRRQERLYEKEREDPLAKHTAPVTTVAFSADGTMLATGGGDDAIILWDTETWEEITTLRGHHARIGALAFTPDPGPPQILSASWDGTIRIWDAGPAPAPAQFFPWPGDPARAAIGLSWNQALFLQGDDAYSLWDLRTLEMTRHEAPYALSNVVAAALGPEANLIAWALGDDQTVRVWDRVASREVARFATDRTPDKLLFSPSGKLLVGLAAEQGGMMWVWDLQARQEVGRLANLWYFLVYLPRFTTDERRLVILHGPQNRTLCLWDLDSGEQRPFDGQTEGWITSLALAPDGKTLATVSHDGSAHLWGMATRRQLRSFPSAQHMLWAVTFSADSQRVFTGGAQGVIQVWDIATGRELVTLPGGTVIYYLHVHRDGNGLLSAENNGLRVWQAPAFDKIQAWEDAGGGGASL